MCNLNEIDLKELVQKQLEISNLTSVSTYNYVNSINSLLRDCRNQALSFSLIADLRSRCNLLTKIETKSMTEYYIDFLDDILMDRASRPARNITLNCPYCGGKATLKDSSLIYRGTSHGNVYLCENHNDTCDAYVAVHKGDNLPLGTLANTQTRAARQKVHSIIDKLWKEYGFARSDVYKQLASYLGLKPTQCHIGHFDELQCASAISFTKQIIC